jgi:hypothetical protein
MKQYTAEIFKATLPLSDDLFGLLIHDVALDELKQVLNRLTYSPATPISFTSVTLRSRIKKFSEQFVADAEAELAAYFSMKTGRALDVAYPDLLYFADGTEYMFNKSVAAAIGEGLAGFLVQRLYGFRPQARPLRLSPDIIMVRGGRVAFVEAKAALATGRSSITKVVNEAAVEVMRFLYTAPYLKTATYCGFIVGTEILEADRFRCRILEMTQ